MFMNKHFLTNNRGEGHIDTGIKIIIAVIVGALILGGLYALFANVILPEMNTEINGMMDVNTDNTSVRRVLDNSTGTYIMQYSLDRKRWLNAQMPDYGEGASVYQTFSAGEDTIYHCVLVKKGSTYYVLASADGIHYKEQFNFTAVSVTHFYYGTSDGLPWTAGSWEGKKFCVRWTTGGKNFYKGVTADPLNWIKGEWSELIPIS